MASPVSTAPRQLLLQTCRARMIQLDHISKAFGGQILFNDLTWRINPGERIGLVGPNGAGKSTLCRIIAKVEPSDSGRIIAPSDHSIGYLPQEVMLDSDRSALDEVLVGRAEVLELEARMAELTLKMAEAGDDIEAQEQLSAAYGTLEQRYQVMDGYALRARARAILAGMGFSSEAMDKPINTFSGGWQMRVLLSRLLLQAPDLLLMDEPTNHLDLPSMEWLESFLKDYPGSVVIISHDRYFLNRMVNIIADLAHHTLTLYTGGYDDFLRQREQNAELLRKQADKQRKEIEHMEDFVRRFKAKATKAKQAQSRLKALNKIERIEIPTEKSRNMRFRFPQPPRSGQEVMRLEGITKAYGEHIVYEGVDFRVERGERVALVGPNGAGKSTLLKILADTTGFGGERLLGYNVSINFFAQHQVEALDLKSTPLKEMEKLAGPEIIGQVRSILGAFLFSGDSVDKQVSVLSGGEKSRLALARMLLTPANFLLLDEPTNHLDIQSRDVLEEALADFDGTICFISHDRHFINSLATRVVHVEDNQLLQYLGDYEYYAWKRKQEADAAAAQAAAELAAAGGAPQQVAGPEHTAEGRKARKRREADLRRQKAQAMGNRQKELTQTEADIATAEQEKEATEALMADPALYNKGKDEVQRVTRRNAELDSKLEALYERWEVLAAEIEEIEAQFSLDA